MNEHLKVLRSLTSYFYFKRGDQASIIGGVIEFIKELHQVLQASESKKQRKSLSPSPGPSPRPEVLHQLSPQPAGSPEVENFKELGACCNSSVADVEAKISESNVLLKVISKRIPGQFVKIITALEKLSFEVLHLNISSTEDTVLSSFVIKRLGRVSDFRQAPPCGSYYTNYKTLALELGVRICKRYCCHVSNTR